MAREILVIERAKLFDGVAGKAPEGLLGLETDYIQKIISNHFFKARDLVENDLALKQPIPFVWLINTKIKKVFVYKRKASDGDYKETRHINNYSGGVGGHIDKDTEKNSANPVFDAMMREIKEELVMNEYPTPKIIGYLNSEIDVYNGVHFGIVGIAEISGEAKPTSDGIESGGFYSISEFEELMANPSNKVENWTNLSWPFVKSYIEKLG